MEVFKMFGFSVYYTDSVADKITDRVSEGWKFHQIVSVDVRGEYTNYNVLMSMIH